MYNKQYHQGTVTVIGDMYSNVHQHLGTTEPNIPERLQGLLCLGIENKKLAELTSSCEFPWLF